MVFFEGSSPNLPSMTGGNGSSSPLASVCVPRSTSLVSTPRLVSSRESHFPILKTSGRCAAYALTLREEMRYEGVLCERVRIPRDGDYFCEFGDEFIRVLVDVLKELRAGRHGG